LEFFLIKKNAPDIITTSNGDQILPPYLFYRSKINGGTDKVEQNINREQPKNPNWKGIGSSATTLSPSSSFISYGRISFSSYEKQDSNTSLRPSPNNSRPQVQKVISTILK
jgi:DNA polymerase elongation subunit (family B)